VSFTPTAESLALAVDECLYGRACPPSLSLRRGGRDVVPLSPAVREANLRNQVVPRDFPWGSTQIDVKKLHEHCVSGAFWKNLMLELQIKIPPCLEGLKLCYGKLMPVVGICQGKKASID